MPLTRRDALLVAAVMALALVLRALPGPRTIDDAFITFRYSRNIIEGAGFVYNPGVQTLGTTTPLYTLLMAAAGGVFGAGPDSFPWYALAVSALADALTAALLLLLARRLTGNVWAGALLGALWALAPASVTFAVGGMETSVAILWLAAASSSTWWTRRSPPGHCVLPRNCAARCRFRTRRRPRMRRG